MVCITVVDIALGWIAVVVLAMEFSYSSRLLVLVVLALGCVVGREH